ncbi:MAG: hypothetical protein R6X02_34630 [Enhygromyxa sp.]
MTVQLIASCTDRKRAKVPDKLRLRSVRPGENRSTKWLAELERNSAPPKPARELYGGEHWQLVLDLETQLQEAGREVRLWVASAGYGLVSADTPLKPYSATFSPREPDGVPAEEASAWWDALCAGSSGEKTLQSLAERADTLVVIASAKYLRAMLPDLRRARQPQPDPERLIVFSGSGLPELDDSLVLVDDRIQVRLGGTKQGLAARTARHLLAEAQSWPPTATAMKQAYARLVSGESRPESPNRERHPDDDVEAFINKQLDENPRVGWTKLLRAWRDSGRACEQKRFRGLYQDVKSKRE